MMNPELKSSDEILKELFGLCNQNSVNNSDESSAKSKSDSDDDEPAAGKNKHKKKKKKHKKNKKRHRSSSVESERSTEHKSHKRKKKKSHKSSDDEKFKKIKIKKEPEDPKAPFNDLEGIEQNNENLMDSTTGKTLTIDEVFNSFGILTKSEIKKELKSEKTFPVKIKKEKGCEEETNSSCDNIVPVTTKRNDQISLKVERESSSADKNDPKQDKNLSDIFEPKDKESESDKSKSKKISIKNLKNSCVYEATIKEVEERERQKAEKYEEGEITSSTSSENEVSGESEDEKKNKKKSSRKEKHRRKHKHRSKSHESSKSKHRSRSRHSKSEQEHEKHSHHHKSHRSHHENISPHRSQHSSRPYNRYLHNPVYRHPHYHYNHHTRASSVESRPFFKSERSPKPRSKNRGNSKDSHSRTRPREISKERKSRSKSIEKIDKQKLLEIARKNAITLLQQGALPASVIVNKDKIASIKAGGKTVDELTDFCKLLSKKDAEGQESVSSGSDLESNEEKAFHHPFQIKERPSSIVMNIRNAVSLPTKTAQEKTLELSKQLGLQYPVSSGQQHRTTESEWVPVEKLPEPVIAPQPVKPISPPPPPPNILGSEPFYTMNSSINPPSITYPIAKYSNNNGYESTVFPTQKSNVDIGSVVAQRLEAIRRLSENPRDPVGNSLIQVANSKMKVWAESKVTPGLFTGSTGVKPLTVAELSSGGKAWPKKNQFIVAKPVVSDKGEALMKKMGWQPGEGLGKYKQGPPEPCEISMKTDRKGLAEQPVVFQQSHPVKKPFELSQNKHPVSLLNEYCSRKKIGVPQYDCEEKEGAGRRKLFLFSVTVQGAQYTPKMPCNNKKQSKIEAATLCLQSLGLLPVG